MSDLNGDLNIEKVDSRITSLRAELSSRHDALMARAKDQGRISGSINAPPVSQEEPYPFEGELWAKYQQQVAELSQLAQPLLEGYHAEHSKVEQNLGRTDSEWKALAAEVLEDLEHNTRERRERTQERHQHRLDVIDDEIDTQIQAPFNVAQERLRDESDKVGRQFLDIWFKSSWLYVLFLGLIGLAEFPLNLKVFENFREGVTSTMLMAASLVLAIPLAAHFAGLSLKRRKERGINWAFFIILSGMIVALSVYAGLLRSEYVATLTDYNDPINMPTFVLIAVLLFTVGLLLAYGHYDESSQFQSAWEKFDRAEAEFQRQKPEYEELRRKERDRYGDQRNAIDQEYSAAKHKIDAMESNAVNERFALAALHDSTLAVLVATETQCQARYVEAVMRFRTINLQARRNHAEPACFKSDPRPLELLFDDYAELDHNRRKPLEAAVGAVGSVGSVGAVDSVGGPTQ